MHEQLPFQIKGHVLITDDLGTVLLDKYNAIHPQNMARAIARSLANEANGNIYRIAFGNGGTVTDAAFTVTYKEPNTGQNNNVNQTYDTRLYNETYSEIVDEQSTLVGTDPGSSDETGTRPGAGTNPSGDLGGVAVTSEEVGFTSLVTVTAVINPSEPTGQNDNGNVTDTENAFVFDELGLYTTGAPAKPAAASVDIDLGSRLASSDSGLLPNTEYNFEYQIAVPPGTTAGDELATPGTIPFVTVDFTTPASGTGGAGAITFGDLCEAINTGDTGWNLGGVPPLGAAKMKITSNTTAYPSLIGVNTNGFLRIITDDADADQYVNIDSGTTGGTTNDMIVNLSAVIGSAVILGPVPGQDAGIQNSPTAANEVERLLTHIIFAPVLKSASRTLSVTYTLSVAVAPTAT